MSENKSGADALYGVDCQVMGCKYHHPGGQCSAANIKVEAPDAAKKTETFCGTFAPNSSC
ncbi:MAG: DUF1540 domain-containing protein [Oscillospiraceae bacterium]|nr:DUF1540 domain-containing protein [Oscillospiraceae bacterium]